MSYINRRLVTYPMSENNTTTLNIDFTDLNEKMKCRAQSL